MFSLGGYFRSGMLPPQILFAREIRQHSDILNHPATAFRQREPRSRNTSDTPTSLVRVAGEWRGFWEDCEAEHHAGASAKDVQEWMTMFLVCRAGRDYLGWYG